MRSPKSSTCMTVAIVAFAISMALLGAAMAQTPSERAAADRAAADAAQAAMDRAWNICTGASRDPVIGNTEACMDYNRLIDIHAARETQAQRSALAAGQQRFDQEKAKALEGLPPVRAHVKGLPQRNIRLRIRRDDRYGFGHDHHHE